MPVDVQVMSPPCASGTRLGRPLNATGATGALCYRMRPALGGVSIGHVQFRYGTLSTLVEDAARRGVFALLSNNHVLALSNAARPGDPIVQPGTADGGQYPHDLIACLDRFVPIPFGSDASNLVDAAIACVGFGDVERRIYDIGCPLGVRGRESVALGEEVQKVGRTTGFTRGRVVGIHATVDIQHGGGRVARFREQLIATLGCADGDSGWLVLDLDRRAVGLIAGISGTHSVANYIETVQVELGIVVTQGLG